VVVTRGNIHVSVNERLTRTKKIVDETAGHRGIKRREEKDYKDARKQAIPT